MTTPLSTILKPGALQALTDNGTAIQIVDVRTQEAFIQQRIPHSLHFDIAEANRSQEPIKGLLPETHIFATALAKAGIQMNQPIVVVDDSAGPPAGRLAWTLAAFGHPHIAILDGGLRAWIAEGRPTESGAANGDTIRTAPTEALAINHAYIADANEILQKLDNTNTIILDARTAAEYRGEDVRSKHGGHIPGAIHLDWQDIKDQNGYFKSETEIKKLLADRNITPDKEIITYCQSHQRSALMWVILKHLGYKNIKGYPGAWSDWGNSDALPISRS